METIRHFLRRSEVWVTGLQHRFSDDIFFRTTVYVISLEALLAAGSVTVIALILKAHNSLLTLLGVAFIAVTSGAALSYVTLRPTRNSLESQKLFISNIAHELRTPLAVIKTLSEVEMLDDKLPQETKKAIGGILEEIERASGVINNLLSLNKLLRPERMEFESVEMGPILERVMARSRKMAAEREVEIIIHKTDFSTVAGNAVALEQMVINLVNNAIQYTPKGRGGRVTLTLEPDYAGMVLLSVADTGMGIAREDLYHIFEPFYRADKSRVRKQGGSGLGLAIVNEIVRTHHGKIRIQSTPGKGTVFTIFLPVGRVVPKTDEGSDTKLHELAMDFSSGAPHSS